MRLFLHFLMFDVKETSIDVFFFETKDNNSSRYNFMHFPCEYLIDTRAQ